MEDFQFSLATPADAPEVLALYRSLVGTPGCVWTNDYPALEDVEADIKDQSLYILRQNGELVAATAASPSELGHLPWAPKNPCELARLGVSFTKQGHGIGSIMLGQVMRATQERGFDGMVLLASIINQSALALYDKNGFERCGQTFLYGGDFYCYQKVYST